MNCRFRFLAEVNSAGNIKGKDKDATCILWMCQSQYEFGNFVRNDGSPALVGAATVCGGVFNVFLIEFLHLFSKKNTISFVQVTAFWKRGMEIASIGVSSFLCSVGMGFLVVLFNNQIMRYFGSNELAVYGVAGNLFTLIQIFSYGIGNAAQPIVAENMGAGKQERVRQTRNLGCFVAAGIGLCAMGIALLLPVQRVKQSLTVSLLHSFLLGAVFVYLFPAVWGGMSIWYVMLFAEMITAALAILMFWKERTPHLSP